jgi:hypothetical protein
MSVGCAFKEGKGDAFMSAGNSGAVMAAALFGVGEFAASIALPWHRSFLPAKHPRSVDLARIRIPRRRIWCSLLRWARFTPNACWA